MSNVIYIKRNYNSRNDDSHEMAQYAISDFLTYIVDLHSAINTSFSTKTKYLTELSDSMTPYTSDIKILVAPNGKPYTNNNVHFSISHSKNYWICAVSKTNIGIDIQKKVNLNYLKISERFFSSNERQYVMKHGEDAFFQIWTRKEALAKYTGDGFFRTKIDTVSSTNDLLQTIRYNGHDCNIESVLIDSDYECSICSRN